MTSTTTAGPIQTDQSELIPTAASYLANQLYHLGVRFAFGVSGGGVAHIWEGLSASAIQVVHCRHESNAMYCACEASLASGRPVVVFVTTGPGITNALTGAIAARTEGAHVILLSGRTPLELDGAYPVQESSRNTMPYDYFFTPSTLFDEAIVVTGPEPISHAVSEIELALRASVHSPYLAHISMPPAVQAARITTASDRHFANATPFVTDVKARSQAVAVRQGSAGSKPSRLQIGNAVRNVLDSSNCAFLVGWGARNSTELLLPVCEALSSPVVCTPRAKGTFPETHPLYLGTTGFAGTPGLPEAFAAAGVRRLVVLGSRLSDGSTSYDVSLVPPSGLTIVDVSPNQISSVFQPFVTDVASCSTNEFLAALTKQLGLSASPRASSGPVQSSRDQSADLSPASRRVSPVAVMNVVQELVVDQGISVLAECGNSFAWATHFLRFGRPNQWRVSTSFGAMGHMAAGVVGRCLASDAAAVCVVGDGAMLMQNEVSTAVQLNIPAIWLVMNDSAYGMCRQGASSLGFVAADSALPLTDFSQYARALGAAGASIESTDELKMELSKALGRTGPTVLDVHLDPDALAPAGARNAGLIRDMVTYCPATGHLIETKDF